MPSTHRFLIGAYIRGRGPLLREPIPAVGAARPRRPPDPSPGTGEEKKGIAAGTPLLRAARMLSGRMLGLPGAFYLRSVTTSGRWSENSRRSQA